MVQTFSRGTGGFESADDDGGADGRVLVRLVGNEIQTADKETVG